MTGNIHGRLIHIGLVMMLCYLLTACSGSSNIIPPAKLVEIKPSIHAKTLWTKNIGSGSDDQYLRLSPALSDDVLYTASYDGYVTAIQSHNGQAIWSKELDRKLSATPLVADGHVYVGSMFAHLVKLDAKTGENIWDIPVPSSMFARPVAGENLIVVNPLNAEVAAYTKAQGQEQWKQNPGTPPLMLTGNSAPIVSDDKQTVFVGLDNGELSAYDIEAGTKKWDVPVALPRGGSDVSRMVDVVGTPVIDEGIIYVTGYQGNVAAINSQNGAIVWKKAFSSYTGLALKDQTLYLVNEDSYIYALDKSSGVQQWKQTVLRGRKVTRPVVVGQYIAVSDFEGYVHFFNRHNGDYADRVKIGGDGISSVGVTKDNMVFVQTNNGTLAAIEI